MERGHLMPSSSRIGNSDRATSRSVIAGKRLRAGAPGDTAQRRSSATAIFAPSTYRAYERAVVAGLNDRRGMVPVRRINTRTSRRKHPMFAILLWSRIAVIILSLGVVAAPPDFANAETWNQAHPAAPK